MIRIEGRGWRGGTVKLTPSAQGLQIRVDDDWNPELWFQVSLSAGMVVNFAGAIGVLRDEPHMEAGPIELVWGQRKNDSLSNAEIPPFTPSPEKA